MFRHRAAPRARPIATRRATRARIAALALAALVVGSCTMFQTTPEYSEQDLREDLADFARDFRARVGTAANLIADGSRDRQVRRAALIWQIVMPPQVHEAAFVEDPQEAYLACLVVTDLQLEYLTAGDGKALFGADQPLAVAAAESLADDIRAIGRLFVPADDIPGLDQQVAAALARRPITGPYFSISTRTSFLKTEQEQGLLSAVASIPMAPFSALKGVGSTPDAIREFTAVADQMAGIVNNLPNQVRLQTQLLLYDLEDRVTVREGLAAFQEAADSMDRMAATLETLPADIRGTISSIPGTVAALQPTFDSAERIATALHPAAEELRRGSEAWERILASDPDEPPDESPPFDIRDYATTAEEIAAMAAELARASERIESLLAPERAEQLEGHVLTLLNAAELRIARVLNETEQRSQGLLDASGSEARAVVDHAALRLGQLLLGFFLLLSIYRLTIGRRPKAAAA